MTETGHAKFLVKPDVYPDEIAYQDGQKTYSVIESRTKPIILAGPACDIDRLRVLLKGAEGIEYRYIGDPHLSMHPHALLTPIDKLLIDLEFPDPMQEEAETVKKEKPGKVSLKTRLKTSKEAKPKVISNLLAGLIKSA